MVLLEFGVRDTSLYTVPFLSLCLSLNIQMAQVTWHKRQVTCTPPCVYYIFARAHTRTHTHYRQVHYKDTQAQAVTPNWRFLRGRGREHISKSDLTKSQLEYMQHLDYSAAFTEAEFHARKTNPGILSRSTKRARINSLTSSIPKERRWDNTFFLKLFIHFLNAYDIYSTMTPFNKCYWWSSMRLNLFIVTILLGVSAL